MNFIDLTVSLFCFFTFAFLCIIQFALYDESLNVDDFCNLSFFLVFGSISDILSSYFAFGVGASELSPFGPFYLFFGKLFLVPFIIFLLFRYYKPSQYWFYFIVFSFQFLAVANNISVILFRLHFLSFYF